MLPSIFLSYARTDDEPFVKKLYESLTDHGLTVWFDRVSMPSRGLSFLQEIRDTISYIDQLILVMGTNSVQDRHTCAPNGNMHLIFVKM